MIDIVFEYIPENYVGSYPAITIHRKKSQYQEAQEMASVIQAAINKYYARRNINGQSTSLCLTLTKEQNR